MFFCFPCFGLCFFLLCVDVYVVFVPFLSAYFLIVISLPPAILILFDSVLPKISITLSVRLFSSYQIIHTIHLLDSGLSSIGLNEQKSKCKDENMEEMRNKKQTKKMDFLFQEIDRFGWNWWKPKIQTLTCRNSIYRYYFGIFSYMELISYSLEDAFFHFDSIGLFYSWREDIWRR